MDESKYKHLFPIAMEVEKGKKYLWCGCGESKTPPLCDKEHCGKKALYYLAELNEVVNFCNCKHTKSPPFCDGSHAKLLIELLKKK